MASTYQCSPALHRADGETCLPQSALERLRRTWNKTHPRNKIAKTRKAIRNGKNELWYNIRNAMKSTLNCNTEYCFVKKVAGSTPEIKRSMLAYFRPEKPSVWDKKPRHWLDSQNIQEVLLQYEQADPTFEFIGPVPIDFDKKEGSFGQCVVNELCRLDLAETMKRGKHKLGIVFNLDPHDEPGSHWMCGFIDIPAKSAYYFDSYGYKPPKEVVVLFKRFKEQGCTNIYYNDIRHQRKGSECGMYCIFVIVSLLQGRSFYDICKNVIDDDTMNSFRDVLYAEENPRREAIDKALPHITAPRITPSPTHAQATV